MAELNALSFLWTKSLWCRWIQSVKRKQPSWKALLFSLHLALRMDCCLQPAYGGDVDMPLSGACTYGLCLTSKRGHKGSVLPQLRSIQHTADSSMYVSLWLSLGPSSFHFRLLSIPVFFFLFWKMHKGSTAHSLCVGLCVLLWSLIMKSNTMQSLNTLSHRPLVMIHNLMQSTLIL